MLSLIPLRAMHAEALEAGVPLLDLSALAARSQVLKSSFALDDEGNKAFNVVVDHYQSYLRVSGNGGRDIGKELLAHMRVFYSWRFHAIRRNQQRTKQGLPPVDAATAASRERGFAAERARVKTDVDSLEEKWQADQRALGNAEARLNSARIARARFGSPISPALESETAALRGAEQASRDRYLSRKAQLDTYANDATLGAALAAYDARLVADAKAIIAHQKANPKLPMRPHYANLVAAYTAEFVGNNGLRDDKVIAFFDKYVHDSLAGFAMDATLPSDPRVVYVGGDSKLRFAGVLDGQGVHSRAA